jgi:hypothetical protein
MSLPGQRSVGHPAGCCGARVKNEAGLARTGGRAPALHGHLDLVLDEVTVAETAMPVIRCGDP